MNFKMKISNLKFLVVLISIVKVSSAQITTGSDERTCGTLYSGENSTGIQFPLGDEDYSVTLAEDQRASDDGWNVTGSISVENGCKLKVCNETHLDGSCTTLKHGSHSVTQNNIISDTASVQCSCDKQCKCSDVHIKKSKCGRAYLSGSCSICNTLYTDLTTNKNRSRKFPEDFEKKVKAIRLRRGCELRIYNEEDQEGDETVITDETTEDFDGEIRSYECDCDDDLYKPKERPPRPDAYPELVEVPASMDDVIQMLSQENFTQHPGLKASRRSYRNKRSTKNAYILLVGSTGAGKSTTINLLFDNPHITKAGDFASTTDNIHEFRIPVPIDELGIGNSELRVIDTPGLGDTRGLEYDAKFLATLDNYLSTHEELKDRIPNVVLILHPFHDKRFDGEGSRFVKMIRGLDIFSKRITDENYSNVIFVFSHLCSTERSEQRNPGKRIKKFQQVIQDYSLYPRPTHIVVAENKPDKQYLPIVNGYIKLPNFEYYPRNLFEKLELVTQRGGDPIGLGVFRTAFRDSENFNITPSTFYIQESNKELTQKYLQILMHANYGVVKTEVSQHLNNTWNQLDPKLRERFPFDLTYLQKALNLRHINNMIDVPRTTTEILNLLTVLKLNEATKTLLEKGLNIKSPEFPLNTVAGYCYDVFKDMPLTNSPFNLQQLKYSDIGFMIPSALSCDIAPGTTERFRRFKNKLEYLQHRLQSLGIDIKGTIPVDKFTDDIKPGLNIEEFSFKNDSCSVTASKDFRFFEFILNEKLELTPEFKETVKGLPSFNKSDHENVAKWQQFFNTYGTHVVKSIYGGGSIQIKLESDSPINDEFKQTMFDLITFAEDLTFDMIGEDDDTSNRTVLTSKPGLSHTMKFVGGNPLYHSADLTRMSVTEANKLLINWKKSLKFSPAILNTEMRLVPISQIVKKLRQNYTEEIDRAARLHFNSELIYTPPPSKRNQGPGLDRDSTPRMRELELELKLKEQENIANQLSLERFKVEKEMELKNITIQSNERKAAMQRSETAIRLKHEADERAKEHSHQTTILNIKTDAETQHKNIEANIAAQKLAHEEEMAKRRMEYEARQREIAHRRHLEVIEASKGGCLKKGTHILMADFSEKPVEMVKVGDILLDKDFHPTRVLGNVQKFLLNQTFYGFDDDSFFFTNNHLFVGPNLGVHTDMNMELYAVSPSELYVNNPLMKYLNVSEMKASEGVMLYNFKNVSSELTLTSKIIDGVYEDPMNYSVDTPMYDIQVDSPTGTYFANGYVCRHEIPPVEYWPNTMSILFRLMSSEQFEKIEEIPYNVGSSLKLEIISEQVANAVGAFILKLFANVEGNMQVEEDEKVELMTLEIVDVESSISRIFRFPTLSTFAVSLYANAGPVMASYLDSERGDLLSDTEMARVQKHLLEFIANQIQIKLLDFATVL